MKIRSYLFFISCRLFTVYCLLSNAYCYAQRTKIDSILTVIKKDKSDTNRINHLIDAAWEISVSDPDSAMLMSNEALHSSENIKLTSTQTGWPIGIASSYNQIGTFYKDKGDLQMSMEFYRKGLDLLKVQEKEVTTDKRSTVYAKEAGIIGNIGVVYWRQGNYSKALELYFQALKLEESLGRKDAIIRHLSNIGIVYKEQKEFERSLEYYFKALKIAEEIKNEGRIATILGNIGLVYSDQKKYSEALEYYQKALEKDKALGNKRGVSRHLGNMGIVYNEQGDHKKAIEHYLMSLKLREELGAKNLIATSLGNIGELYIKTKEYSKAENYLNKALAIDTAIDFMDHAENTYELLSDVYAKTNDPKKSLEYYKKAMMIKDSLFTQEKNKEITRKEMNYEFDKKEMVIQAEHDKETAMGEEKSRKQKLIILFVFISLFIVIVFAGFIFRSLRITRKQKDIIAEQKHIVEQQKHLVEEKQKEIIDSINYARRIQTSQLPTVKYIEKSLNRLMKK